MRLKSLKFAQLATIELLEPRNDFSGFSTSRAVSTLEFNQNLFFFFFFFSTPLGFPPTSATLLET